LIAVPGHYVKGRERAQSRRNTQSACSVDADCSWHNQRIMVRAAGRTDGLGHWHERKQGEGWFRAWETGRGAGKRDLVFGYH